MTAVKYNLVVCFELETQSQQTGSDLELFEEDGRTGPIHDGEERLVSHEAHQAEGALVFLPAHLLLQEMSSNLILQL